MNFNYADLAAVALELLTEFGQDVTRRSYTTGTYNYSTASASVTTADTTRKGVMLDFKFGKKNEQGSLIQASDKRLLVDGSAVINDQDHFIIGGVDYSIISIGEVNPAGSTTVLYDLHLRAS